MTTAPDRKDTVSVHLNPAFGNVEERFLPAPEARPTFTFGAPSLHYAYSTDVLNAGVALLDDTIDRYGGDRTAIIELDAAGGRREWTYAGLAEAVHRLAGGLRALGVGPGDRVMTRFGETPAAAITQLAAWRIGALIVPAATAESARELSFMIRDTEPRVVVCQCDAEGPLLAAADEFDDTSNGDAPTLVGWPEPLSGHEHSIATLSAGQPDSAPAHPTRPLDGSGIYYTGGTTGLPKGCLHTHAAEIALADLNLAARGIGPDDVLLSHTPIGHAFGNGEKINFPLRAGACVVYADRPSPDRMWQIVTEERVSLMAGAPTMWRMMLRASVPEPEKRSRLRATLSAGEVLDVHTTNEWADKLGFELDNAIGMTPMRHLFIHPTHGGERIVSGLSVGAPLPGYEARLVDSDGNSAPAGGEPARLAVRGPSGITYWINAHPDLRERAGRDVRCGWSLLDDAYTRDAEGWLWFAGRLDDMIVTAGRQVAPIEVEQVLAEHPSVAEVAVIPVPDDVRGTAVCAVVQLREGIEGTPELTATLQAYAKEQMAAYKYPRRITYVDALPKDQVGKIQRRQLREDLAAAESKDS